MTLSIKNGIFNKIELNVFSVIWKEFQLLQILNDLSIRHLINVIIYENDVKLLKI